MINTLAGRGGEKANGYHLDRKGFLSLTVCPGCVGRELDRVSVTRVGRLIGGAAVNSLRGLAPIKLSENAFRVTFNIFKVGTEVRQTRTEGVTL